MTVLSKEFLAEEHERRRKRLLQVLGPAVFLLVCEGSMLIQARPQLVFDTFNGNSAESAKFLSSIMGIGAAMEFFVNPVLGRTSDSVGRRPLLLACAFGTALSRFSVFLHPKSKSLLTGDRVVSMALITAFFSCIRAAQADVLTSNSDLAMAAGQIARYAGLGIFIGPYLDTLMTRIGGGDPRFAFLGSAAVAASVGALLYKDFDETLEQDKKKPFDVPSCNPFSFVTLLGTNKVVSALMGVMLLQAFGDGRNIQEVNTVFMKRHLKWGKLRVSNMIASYGAVVVFGALLVKKSMSTLGLKGHTSFSNMCQIAGSLLWGLAPASPPFDTVFTRLSLLVSLGAQRKRDAVECIATRILVADTDLGKGQIAAALSNWRSLASILGPLAFGNLYAWGTANPEKLYFPGAPFFAIAGVTVCAEQLFRSLTDKQMRLEDEDDEKEKTSATATAASTIRANRVLTQAKTPAPARLAPGSTFLNKTRQKVRLEKKIELSHDTKIFRFALPAENMVLGLPVGKHIKFFCPNPKPVKEGEWNGRPDPESKQTEIERKYTPGSLNTDLGYIDVVVKVYKGGVIDRFPDGGKMSQFLDSMTIGQQIDVSGPFGLVEYHGNGDFSIRRKRNHYLNIGLIAGGTGITPMIQLIRTVLNNPNDRTKLSLLFANQTEDDILLRRFLEDLAMRHPDRFRVWYTVDRPPANWKFSSGFINQQMLEERMPPNRDGSLILMCGPPPMIKHACMANLTKLGYPKEKLVEF